MSAGFRLERKPPRKHREVLGELVGQSLASRRTTPEARPAVADFSNAVIKLLPKHVMNELMLSAEELKTTIDEAYALGLDAPAVIQALQQARQQIDLEAETHVRREYTEKRQQAAGEKFLARTKKLLGLQLREMGEGVGLGRASDVRQKKAELTDDVTSNYVSELVSSQLEKAMVQKRYGQYLELAKGSVPETDFQTFKQLLEQYAAGSQSSEDVRHDSDYTKVIRAMADNLEISNPFEISGDVVDTSDPDVQTAVKHHLGFLLQTEVMSVALAHKANLFESDVSDQTHDSVFKEKSLRAIKAVGLSSTTWSVGARWGVRAGATALLGATAVSGGWMVIGSGIAAGALAGGVAAMVRTGVENYKRRKEASVDAAIGAVDFGEDVVISARSLAQNITDKLYSVQPPETDPNVIEDKLLEAYEPIAQAEALLIRSRIDQRDYVSFGLHNRTQAQNELYAIIAQATEDLQFGLRQFQQYHPNAEQVIREKLRNISETVYKNTATLQSKFDAAVATRDVSMGKAFKRGVLVGGIAAAALDVGHGLYDHFFPAEPSVVGTPPPPPGGATPARPSVDTHPATAAETPQPSPSLQAPRAGGPSGGSMPSAEPLPSNPVAPPAAVAPHESHVYTPDLAATQSSIEQDFNINGQTVQTTLLDNGHVTLNVAGQSHGYNLPTTMDPHHIVLRMNADENSIHVYNSDSGEDLGKIQVPIEQAPTSPSVEAPTAAVDQPAALPANPMPPLVQKEGWTDWALRKVHLEDGAYTPDLDSTNYAGTEFSYDGKPAELILQSNGHIDIEVNGVVTPGVDLPAGVDPHAVHIIPSPKGHLLHFYDANSGNQVGAIDVPVAPTPSPELPHAGVGGAELLQQPEMAQVFNSMGLDPSQIHTATDGSVSIDDGASKYLEAAPWRKVRIEMLLRAANEHLLPIDATPEQITAYAERAARNVVIGHMDQHDAVTEAFGKPISFIQQHEVPYVKGGVIDGFPGVRKDWWYKLSEAAKQQPAVPQPSGAVAPSESTGQLESIPAAPTPFNRLEPFLEDGARFGQPQIMKADMGAGVVEVLSKVDTFLAQHDLPSVEWSVFNVFTERLASPSEHIESKSTGDYEEYGGVQFYDTIQHQTEIAERAVKIERAERPARQRRELERRNTDFEQLVVARLNALTTEVVQPLEVPNVQVSPVALGEYLTKRDEFRSIKQRLIDADTWLASDPDIIDLDDQATEPLRPKLSLQMDRSNIMLKTVDTGLMRGQINFGKAGILDRVGVVVKQLRDGSVPPEQVLERLTALHALRDESEAAYNSYYDTFGTLSFAGDANLFTEISELYSQTNELIQQAFQFARLRQVLPDADELFSKTMGVLEFFKIIEKNTQPDGLPYSVKNQRVLGRLMNLLIDQQVESEVDLVRIGFLNAAKLCTDEERVFIGFVIQALMANEVNPLAAAATRQVAPTPTPVAPTATVPVPATTKVGRTVIRRKPKEAAEALPAAIPIEATQPIEGHDLRALPGFRSFNDANGLLTYVDGTTSELKVGSRAMRLDEYYQPNEFNNSEIKFKLLEDAYIYVSYDNNSCDYNFFRVSPLWPAAAEQSCKFAELKSTIDKMRTTLDSMLAYDNVQPNEDTGHEHPDVLPTVSDLSAIHPLLQSYNETTGQLQLLGGDLLNLTVPGTNITASISPHDRDLDIHYQLPNTSTTINFIIARPGFGYGPSETSVHLYDRDNLESIKRKVLFARGVAAERVRVELTKTGADTASVGEGAAEVGGEHNESDLSFFSGLTSYDENTRQLLFTDGQRVPVALTGLRPQEYSNTGGKATFIFSKFPHTTPFITIVIERGMVQVTHTPNGVAGGLFTVQFAELTAESFERNVLVRTVAEYLTPTTPRPSHTETKPAQQRERRERKHAYELGESTEASARHPQINEDYSLVDPGLDLFGVFDGNSIPPGGNAAAKAAMEFIHAEVSKLEDDLDVEQLQDAMYDIVQRANTAVNQLVTATDVNVYNATTQRIEAKLQGIDNARAQVADRVGTTATVVKMWHGPNGERKAIITHAGDSRVYKRKTDGSLVQLTTDHKVGRYVSKTVGGPDKLNPESLVVDMEPGEELLLLTDGEHDNLEDTEIAATVNKFDNCQTSTDQLVRAAVLAAANFNAKKRKYGKGFDDMTALRIREREIAARPAAAAVRPPPINWDDAPAAAADEQAATPNPERTREQLREDWPPIWQNIMRGENTMTAAWSKFSGVVKALPNGGDMRPEQYRLQQDYLGATGDLITLDGIDHQITEVVRDGQSVGDLPDHIRNISSRVSSYVSGNFDALCATLETLGKTSKPATALAAEFRTAQTTWRTACAGMEHIVAMLQTLDAAIIADDAATRPARVAAESALVAAANETSSGDDEDFAAPEPPKPAPTVPVAVERTIPPTRPVEAARKAVEQFENYQAVPGRHIDDFIASIPKTRTEQIKAQIKAGVGLTEKLTRGRYLLGKADELADLRPDMEKKSARVKTARATFLVRRREIFERTTEGGKLAALRIYDAKFKALETKEVAMVVTLDNTVDSLVQTVSTMAGAKQLFETTIPQLKDDAETIVKGYEAVAATKPPMAPPQPSPSLGLDRAGGPPGGESSPPKTPPPSPVTPPVPVTPATARSAPVVVPVIGGAPLREVRTAAPKPAEPPVPSSAEVGPKAADAGVEQERREQALLEQVLRQGAARAYVSILRETGTNNYGLTTNRLRHGFNDIRSVNMTGDYNTDALVLRATGDDLKKIKAVESLAALPITLDVFRTEVVRPAQAGVLGLGRRKAVTQQVSDHKRRVTVGEFVPKSEASSQDATVLTYVFNSPNQPVDTTPDISYRDYSGQDRQYLYVSIVVPEVLARELLQQAKQRPAFARRLAEHVLRNDLGFTNAAWHSVSASTEYANTPNVRPPYELLHEYLKGEEGIIIKEDATTPITPADVYRFNLPETPSTPAESVTTPSDHDHSTGDDDDLVPLHRPPVAVTEQVQAEPAVRVVGAPAATVEPAAVSAEQALRRVAQPERRKRQLEAGPLPPPAPETIPKIEGSAGEHFTAFVSTYTPAKLAEIVKAIKATVPWTEVATERASLLRARTPDILQIPNRVRPLIAEVQAAERAYLAKRQELFNHAPAGRKRLYVNDYDLEFDAVNNNEKYRIDRLTTTLQDEVVAKAGSLSVAREFYENTLPEQLIHLEAVAGDYEKIANTPLVELETRGADNYPLEHSLSNVTGLRSYNDQTGVLTLANGTSINLRIAGRNEPRQMLVIDAVGFRIQYDGDPEFTITNNPDNVSTILLQYKLSDSKPGVDQVVPVAEIGDALEAVLAEFESPPSDHDHSTGDDDDLPSLHTPPVAETEAVVAKPAAAEAGPSVAVEAARTETDPWAEVTEAGRKIDEIFFSRHRLAYVLRTALVERGLDARRILVVFDAINQQWERANLTGVSRDQLLALFGMVRAEPTDNGVKALVERAVVYTGVGDLIEFVDVESFKESEVKAIKAYREVSRKIILANDTTINCAVPGLPLPTENSRGYGLELEYGSSNSNNRSPSLRISNAVWRTPEALGVKNFSDVTAIEAKSLRTTIEYISPSMAANRSAIPSPAEITVEGIDGAWNALDAVLARFAEEAAPPEPPASVEAAAEQRERHYLIDHATESADGNPNGGDDSTIIDAEHDLFAVLDGLGGSGNGQLASRETAKFIQQANAALADLSLSATRVEVKRIVREANRFLRKFKRDNPEPTNPSKWMNGVDNATAEPGRRINTTLTLAKIWHGPAGERIAIIANVGDSRAYLRKVDGSLEQLTLDHSGVIQRLLDSGTSREDIMTAQQRLARRTQIDDSTSDLERQLASDTDHVARTMADDAKDFNPDIFVMALEPGEQILFTTDGIHDNTTDTVMEDTYRTTPVGNGSRQVIERAKHAVDHKVEGERVKGPDDMTALLVGETTSDDDLDFIDVTSLSDESEIPVVEPTSREVAAVSTPVEQDPWNEVEPAARALTEIFGNGIFAMTLREQLQQRGRTPTQVREVFEAIAGQWNRLHDREESYAYLRTLPRDSRLQAIGITDPRAIDVGMQALITRAATFVSGENLLEFADIPERLEAQIEASYRVMRGTFGFPEELVAAIQTAVAREYPALDSQREVLRDFNRRWNTYKDAAKSPVRGLKGEALLAAVNATNDEGRISFATRVATEDTALTTITQVRARRGPAPRVEGAVEPALQGELRSTFVEAGESALVLENSTVFSEYRPATKELVLENGLTVSVALEALNYETPYTSLHYTF